MNTTSPTLLSGVRDPADKAAWRRFDHLYGELILRYSQRLGLQRADAEDIRQVVMVRLAGALRDFQYDPGKGRFRSFLGRIVQNEVARHWARPFQHREAVSPKRSDALEKHAAAGETDAWEQEWRFHHLRLAMRRVRETFEPRSVELFERLLAGEPVEAVARAFGTTVPAVHKVKQRIRGRLAALIAAQVRAEDQADV